jgi:hypothetical protein
MSFKTQAYTTWLLPTAKKRLKFYAQNFSLKKSIRHFEEKRLHVQWIKMLI